MSFPVQPSPHAKYVHVFPLSREILASPAQLLEKRKTIQEKGDKLDGSKCGVF
jgi:hypothetical protein